MSYHSVVGYPLVYMLNRFLSETILTESQIGGYPSEMI
jgi:hypothetical protein